ncbi:MAG: MFS transporter [Saccharothrix sp.]|nr:MFS transporter [Saccharothrix sp.]
MTVPAPSRWLRLPGAPDFPLLWTASTVSFVGDGMSAAAIPLLAASVSADPLEVASVVVVRWLPWVLFALPAGALADSWDRRRAMWICDLVRAAVTTLLALAVVAGAVTIPVLMVAGFLLTCAGIVFDSNATTVLPTVVGRDPDLVRVGNARLMSAQTAALDFVGPPLGGVLFGWSRALPLVGDALSYLISAALLRRMRGEYRTSTGGLAPADLRTAVPEGLRWLARHPLLRSITLVSGGSNLAAFAESAILVLFAARLGLDAVGFSLLLAAGSVGGLAGGALANRLAGWLGGAVTIRLLLLGDCVGSALLGLAVEPWMLFPVLAFTGFTVMVRNVVHVSLRQTATPDRLLGRVGGAHRLVTYGAIPLGALAGGLVADAFGLRWALFFGSAVYALLFVFAVRTITRDRVAEIERG